MIHVCKECKSKSEWASRLEKRIAEVEKDLHLEKKRTTELNGTLVSIFGMAKDKMWYPSNFKERGECGFVHQKVFVDADLAALKSELGV